MKLFEKNIYTNIAKLLLILVLFAFAGCRKIVSYPPEPEIKYEQGVFSIIKDDLDNNILVYTGTIYFTDGDGNIGWGESDENPNALRPCDIENTHDLYVNLYEEIEGEFVKRVFETDYECVNDTLKNFGENSLDAILPYMSGRGQANSLIGDVEYKIELLTLLSQKIKFDFTIRDRDNNISNTIESPTYIVELPE